MGLREERKKNNFISKSISQTFALDVLYIGDGYTWKK